jgi:hypothetical protein
VENDQTPETLDDEEWAVEFSSNENERIQT